MFSIAYLIQVIGLKIDNNMARIVYVDNLIVEYNHILD